MAFSKLRIFPRSRSTRKSSDLARPPGSFVHFGAKRTDSFSIRTITYDVSKFELVENDSIQGTERGVPDEVNWHEISGLHVIEELSQVAEVFDIPSLLVEDVLNTGARPKLEKRDDIIFVVTKLISFDVETQEIDIQQFSLVLLPDNVLLSFLEGPTEAFDPVVERIKTGSGGRIRKYGADYLLWALLDAVVDHYLFVLDQVEDLILELEIRMQENAVNVSTEELYALKRETGILYRAIRPLREISGGLCRSVSPLINEKTRPFLVDLNDHSLQARETIEHLREGASGLRDFYLSTVSNRMNEVMKVLTCFSTIFLPLTFIAGIYGMNFEHMPELKLEWGYPAVWVAFVVSALLMLWLFVRKRWI